MYFLSPLGLDHVQLKSVHKPEWSFSGPHTLPPLSPRCFVALS